MSVNAPSPRESATGTSISNADYAHFDAIACLAHTEAGLVLSRDKAPMVLARIGKRMRACGLTSLGAYRSLVEDPAQSMERAELIYSLTTNVTSFLREEHHFDILRTRLLPGLADKARAGERVRFWSAGCSSGQEPYSLAMIILEALPNAASLDVRILSTDIDPHILDTARSGRYTDKQVEGLPKSLQKKYLTPDPTSHNAFEVAAKLRELISFRQLNLLSGWPMRGAFDVIFCRNVVIYFDRETQMRLWSRFHAALHPGGHLFLGHSERIDPATCSHFRAVGTTMYEAIGPGQPSMKGVA